MTTGPPYMTCQTAARRRGGPAAVTRIAWQAADALTTARDLAQTLVIGNIANATQGPHRRAESLPSSGRRRPATRQLAALGDRAHWAAAR